MSSDQRLHFRQVSDRLLGVQALRVLGVPRLHALLLAESSPLVRQRMLRVPRLLVVPEAEANMHGLKKRERAAGYIQTHKLCYLVPFSSTVSRGLAER